MVKKWKVTIPELTGNQKRNAYIYLPAGYKADSQKRYPVLYMFDGHNVFFDKDATYGKSWGMKSYMDRTRTQMIIVAVECNHSPDHGRIKEYSPFDFSARGFGFIQGKGKITMDWIVNTLKPYIDSTYPTLSDREHTFLAGSSMGGLMAIYGLLYYNDTFSAAAALSPSLWVNPKASREMVQAASILPDTVLYMDYGELEMGNHARMKRAYASMLKEFLLKGIHLTARIIPGGQHCEASWEKQIPIFMNTILYEKSF